MTTSITTTVGAITTTVLIMFVFWFLYRLSLVLRIGCVDVFDCRHMRHVAGRKVVDRFVHNILYR